MGSAQTALSVVEGVTSVAQLAVSVGRGALPIARFVAGFFPGAAPVVDAITIAAPWLERIASMGAPVKTAIHAGTPIFDAFDKSGPQLLNAFKEVYAIAVNKDPERKEENLTADDIDDAVVMKEFVTPVLLGRAWTKEEEDAWFQRATGAHP
jgi:hypothetical protein